MRILTYNDQTAMVAFKESDQVTRIQRMHYEDIALCALLESLHDLYEPIETGDTK